MGPSPRRRSPPTTPWLWLALLLAQPLEAQSVDGRVPSGRDSVSVPAAPAEETQAGDDARVRRRLLRARGGGALRADSRFVDGHWEYRREGDRGWIALPDGLVQSARLESEALDDLRKRRAALGRASATALVDLSRWALDEGLYDEALRLLDDVLADAPDQADALALLRRDDLPFGLPARADGEPDELVQFASAAPPALREMAVARMAQLPDQAGLRAALLERLVQPSAAGRASAALALRRISADAPLGDAELQELLRRAVRDVSADVRRGAALALRDAGQEGLVVPLAAALGSTSTAIRANSAEALGEMGYSAAVPALVQRLVTLPARGVDGGSYSAPRSHIFVGRQIAFVQDFDVEVAQNAVIGNPQIGTLQEGVSLDVAVLGASGTSYVNESAALRGALEKLTGAKPGNSAAAWKAWWAANGANWGSEAPVPVTNG